VCFLGRQVLYHLNHASSLRPVSQKKTKKGAKV
jgi:hypothetical protein